MQPFLCPRNQNGYPVTKEKVGRLHAIKSRNSMIKSIQHKVEVSGIINEHLENVCQNSTEGFYAISADSHSIWENG